MSTLLPIWQGAEASADDDAQDADAHVVQSCDWQTSDGYCARKAAYACRGCGRRVCIDHCDATMPATCKSCATLARRLQARGAA